MRYFMMCQRLYPRRGLLKTFEKPGLRRIQHLKSGKSTCPVPRRNIKGRPLQLHCTSFDLPPVEPIAGRHIAAAGLTDRISTACGDFFNDPLPKADVITMGMILHDWKLEKKMHLIRAAYAALPPGGALVAIEARTAQLGRFSLSRESWRFVGAGPPARGHGNVEY